MKSSIFHDSSRKQLLHRLDLLTPTSERQWGKMSVAQMLAHCREVQDMYNGHVRAKTPFYIKLFRPVIKKLVLREGPYPRSLQTHPQLYISTEKDFLQEKKRFLASMEETLSMDPRVFEQIPHPIFGSMSYEEKGKALFKHLDHHLTQFGV